MVPKKLYYITRARIPSEKAHSFQIMKMCEAFSSLDYEVNLIVPQRRNQINVSPFEYYAIPEIFKIKFVDVPSLITGKKGGRFLFWLEGLFFALKLLKEVSIDKQSIIFSRSLEVAFFYRFLGYRQVVFEIHDWPKSFHKLFALILRYIPFVVVTAKGLAEECYKAGVKPLVAPNGVDNSFFEPFQPFDKKKIGIPLDKRIIMYIGALEAWKGVSTLMEASKYLGSNMQVVIAGGQPSEVEKLKGKYSDVIFLGQTPAQELVRYQALADILVVPNSSTEAMSSKYTSPIKLFAHLTSRKPIIVSDLPSMRSIVTSDEVVFFNGTTEDLVIKINQVFAFDDITKNKLTNNAYQKSLKFTWRNRALSILALFSNS